MPDTARTKAQLAALLADNTTGDISPQDVRDFLETMHPSLGGCYVSTPVATTVTTAGTYYLGAGITTSTALHRFLHNTAGRLTYTGTPTIHAHIAASISFVTSGTSDRIGVGIAINGAVQTGSINRQLVGTGADVASTALHWDVMMSTNDYIEMWVTNEDASGQTVTLQNGYMFALGMMV